MTEYQVSCIFYIDLWMKTGGPSSSFQKIYIHLEYYDGILAPHMVILS